MSDSTLRRLSLEDSLDDLTDLLHRAYAPLAQAGLRFLATWQDVEVTRQRVEAGECWVLELEGRVVACGTLRLPGTSKGTPWYERPDVAVVEQFAVEPSLQRQGLGTALLEHLEDRARAVGAHHVALDTAEEAAHLVHYYRRRGYGFVERVRWNLANYRSVVLSKPLSASGHERVDEK